MTENPKSIAVGVDGCRAGWFYFRTDGDSVSCGIAENIEALVATLPRRASIFIDIPIGLLDAGPAGRDCDLAARQALGFPRSTSVFSAPAYPVLEATDYEEAKRLSFAAIGKKLSKQAFFITPKIREINDFLLSNPSSGYTIRELHPEVCFWAFNGKKAMRHSKKSSKGYEERLSVLEKRLPEARTLADNAIKRYPRSQLAKDDILDALVAMVVADAPVANLRTFPESPPRDARGLAMEIVYATDGD